MDVRFPTSVGKHGSDVECSKSRNSKICKWYKVWVLDTTTTDLFMYIWFRFRIWFRTRCKAIHGDPDYSAVVVITKTDQGAEGHGMTFTLGRGNEIVKAAAESFKPFVLGKNIKEVCSN